MKPCHLRSLLLCCLLVAVGGESAADGPSTSVDGIHCQGLGLDGSGIAIGQVEPGRPGVPGFDNAAHSHPHVVPAGVFHDVAEAVPNYFLVDNHAQQVAGIMISRYSPIPSVAPEAQLYATYYFGDDKHVRSVLSCQHIALQNDGDVRAINLSYGLPLEKGERLDGNSLFSQFLDWSTRQHQVLYVAAYGLGKVSVPSDHFNGLTVNMTTLSPPSRVFNTVLLPPASGDAFGPRTSVDLVAPGADILAPKLGGTHGAFTGASAAAPHVTGTVALLQQFVEVQIAAGAARFTPDARRHEVIKAVLMNSADKLRDEEHGALLEMETSILDWAGHEIWPRTRLTQVDQSPLHSKAGVGQLNAHRALRQLWPGEYDSAGVAEVPAVGWDYGRTTGKGQVNKYVFDAPLHEGSFVAITLVWDREVRLVDSQPANGRFDKGESFVVDGLTDLDLYLMPEGADRIRQRVNASISSHQNVEHIFFQIPATGEYEFWVRQYDAPLGDQPYAVAWWAVPPKDFGDAAPAYPTRLVDKGARHVETRFEWFGRPGRAASDSVSREFDAIDVTDPDGVPNLRPDIDMSDLDRHDDGVLFYPLTYRPGHPGRLDFTVCTADPDSGRYDATPDRSLYVNGWVDWGTNQVWDEVDNEHLIDGLRLDPSVDPTTSARWSVRAHRQPATKIHRLSVSGDGKCATFRAEFRVPRSSGYGEVWARFRLDYGEDVGRNDPRPLFRSHPSLRDPTLAPTQQQQAYEELGYTRGEAAYGEVEDYRIGSDFGDAPDPDHGGYPTRRDAHGARHLDLSKEWLGEARSVETDACDPGFDDERDQDVRFNLGTTCDLSDQDRFDESRSVFDPGQRRLSVTFTAHSTVSALGYDLMGDDTDGDGQVDEDRLGVPGSEDGPDPMRVSSLDPDNRACGQTIFHVWSTPPQSAGKGRYHATEVDDDRDGRQGEDPIDGRDNDDDGRVDEDPPGTRPLYANIFVDWNGNQSWDDAGEHVLVDAQIAPETFGGDKAYTLGEPFHDANANGIWDSGEPFLDSAGVDAKTYTCDFQVPADVEIPPEFWVRVRLTYAEKSTETAEWLVRAGIAHATEISATGETDRRHSGAAGGALFGEVEDHPVRARPGPGPPPPPPDEEEDEDDESGGEGELVPSVPDRGPKEGPPPPRG